MNWVKVLAQDELSQDARKVVKVENRAILLLHHSGQIYAMENACPHLKLPLQGGKVTDDNASSARGTIVPLTFAVEMSKIGVRGPLVSEEF